MKKLLFYSAMICIAIQAQSIHAEDQPSIQEVSNTQEQSWRHRMAARLYALAGYTKKTTSTSSSTDLFVYNTATRNVLLPKPNITIIADSYQLSPQKKYILTQEINSGVSLNGMVQKAYKARSKEGLNVEKALEKTDTETTITNTQTGKQITSLDNIITYEFNKDETLLLVSMQKPVSFRDLATINTRWARKRSDLHKGKTVRGSNDIYHYQLFDMEAQIILGSFENVEAISFEGNTSNLSVLYEGNSENEKYTENEHYAERINIGEEFNQSFFKKTMNFITKSSSKTLTRDRLEPGYTQPNQPIIKYDFYAEELTVITSDKTIIKTQNVKTYYYSPDKRYLIVQKTKLKMFKNIMTNIFDVDNINLEKVQKSNKIFELINLNSGKIIELSDGQIGIVTYEFSSDERTILYLKPTADNVTQYYLYDIEFEEIVHIFEIGVSVAFAPHSNTEFNTSSSSEKITIERKRTIREGAEAISETAGAVVETVIEKTKKIAGDIGNFFKPKEQQTEQHNKEPELIETKKTFGEKAEEEFDEIKESIKQEVKEFKEKIQQTEKKWDEWTEETEKDIDKFKEQAEQKVDEWKEQAEQKVDEWKKKWDDWNIFK